MTWRVGLLVSPSNAVMEVDFYRSLPHDATLHTSRMCLEDATRAGKQRMLDQFALSAIAALGTVRPHVVVFGGTSGATLSGWAFDREMSARIEQLTGAATVSVAASVNQALQETRALRVDVVTPFGDRVNERVKACIEAEGIQVSAMHGMGLSTIDGAGVPPEAIYSFVQSSVGPRVHGEALYVAGTNYQAMGALSLLKMTYDVPIVTSNLAALRAVKRQLEDLRQREMTRLSS
jgi:maleate cis-trans isomerase